MNLVTYLTTSTLDFGALEWVFFIAQIAVAIAGVYLAFLQVGTHPLRGPILQRLGYALLALGGVGTLLGVLRLAPVELFTMPIWFTIVTLLEVVLVVYALYYALSIYPVRLAAFEETNRSKGARRSSARPQPALQTNGSSGTSSFDAERPVPATGRREARRDRKRRGR